jgi:hypothetical protein
MSGIGINDTLYNLAAEYGPHGFWEKVGDMLQHCSSGQRTWVQAKERWFFWQLASCEEIGGQAESPPLGFCWRSSGVLRATPDAAAGDRERSINDSPPQ